MPPLQTELRTTSIEAFGLEKDLQKGGFMAVVQMTHNRKPTLYACSKFCATGRLLSPAQNLK